MTHIKRAGAIIYDSKCKCLAVVMNKWSRINQEEKWGFPKGHLKDGEHFIKAAIRETYEETGLRLLITDKTPNIVFQDTIYFLVRVSNLVKFQTNDVNEVCEVSWKSFKELANLNKNRALRFICYKHPERNVRIPFKISMGEPVDI